LRARSRRQSFEKKPVAEVQRQKKAFDLVKTVRAGAGDA